MNPIAERRTRRRQELEDQILTALNTDEWTYGYDLWSTTRIRAGRMYPTLKRLEEGGWVESTWDDGSASRLRLRRAMYRRTLGGEALVS